MLRFRDEDKVVAEEVGVVDDEVERGSTSLAFVVGNGFVVVADGIGKGELGYASGDAGADELKDNWVDVSWELGIGSAGFTQREVSRGMGEGRADLNPSLANRIT